MNEPNDLPPSTDPVLVEKQGARAVISINRVDANNAINNDVREGMIWALDAVARDDEVRCVVIQGAGTGAFSVGSDVAQIGALLPQEARAMAERSLAMHERVLTMDKPVVAAIRGACIGAGLELALHCDVRFSRMDGRFGLPGINVGLVPGGGSLDLLARVIGDGQARALALTGGVISAERAFMMGLVTNVVVAEEFDEALDQMTDHLISLPPISIRETKRMLRLARAGETEKAKAAGVEALARCFTEGEARQRLSQLFGGPDPEATLH